MQNKFAFFANFAETIRATLPEEKQAEAYKALCEYGIYGTLPEDPLLKGMCLMAKISLQKTDGRSNNGGNHNPKGINQHSKEVNQVNSGQSGQFLSETETETETRNITPLSMSPQRVDETQLDLEDAIKKVKRFVKPTVDEITSYCREKNKSIDAERFWNFYESKGWKVGKNPMKDWRAAVCNWAKDAAPVVQESYRPAVDTEKLNQTARMAELAKQRMMEQAKLKYGA